VRPYVVHDGLAVYRFGDGEPLLLMPGPHRFARPGLRSADLLIAGFQRRGRRVITFEPPGSGASTRPPDLGMAEMHDCADEALRACAVHGPVDAVGHSMAGLAVLAYAIERPTRVNRLVLIGTGTGGPAYMHAPGALWNSSHPRFRTLAALGILQMVVRTRGPERILLNFITTHSFVDRRLAETVEVGVLDWVRPKEGRTDWHRIARRLDYGPRLTEIRVPTLILCGRFDPQFPPACSEQLATGIEGARLTWFEQSGHFPFIEEQARFWTTVERFLDATGGTAPTRERSSPQ
jgi:pimeloyl-ACP methyl ester carboxylesterase